MNAQIFSDNAAQRVLDRTVELSRISAPSGSECQRSTLVSEWWKRDGLHHVSIDSAGNVWGKVPGKTSIDGPAILICAHLDTVFDEKVFHEVHQKGDFLHGPSVGDNSVAVASLAETFADFPGAGSVPVWLLATTGEEGLGNLRGIYFALDSFTGPIGAVVALEGNYLGRIGTSGICSERWSIKLVGPGGHSWEEAENPSAVHEAAQMVGQLVSNLDVESSRRTINVGRFEGGESVTARAANASLLIDTRSEDPTSISQLRQRIIATAKAAQVRGVDVSLRQLGRRGGGKISHEHRLATLAERAHTELDLPVEFVAVSTDANAAYDLGIPAITLGITEGARQHSLEEWIAISPIRLGMSVLVRTVYEFAAHLAGSEMAERAGSRTKLSVDRRDEHVS